MTGLSGHPRPGAWRARRRDISVRQGVYGQEHVPALTAEEAARLDRHARESAGVPERVLMESAGRAAAQVLQRFHPRGRVVAVLGGGNNGGDALVAIRVLRAWGRDVGWVSAAARPPDPALTHGFDLPPAEGEPESALAAADVVVDGILGTGARGAPRGAAADGVRAIRRAGRPVVALDQPSGVDPTSGEVPGDAVTAAVTVCFGWPKRGLLLPPARRHCGRLLAVEIGFPPPAACGPFEAALITPAWMLARLPERSFGDHKGSAGRLLVCAGRAGMAGAAALAGHAAVRMGAGLVHLLSPEANRVVLQQRVPEAIFSSREDDPALRAAAGAADALVAGPGMGTEAEELRLLEALLEASGNAPILLDADALTVLAAAGRLEGAVAGRPALLTPHPGEMARVTGRSVEEVRRAPLEAARALAAETGATVLLKGAPSLVAAPGEAVLMDAAGSSDLASAGMGDHLAGAAGALLAAGAPPAHAGAIALGLGARAAELAGLGRGLSPLDVSDHLPAALARPGRSSPPRGLPFVVFDQPPRR